LSSQRSQAGGTLRPIMMEGGTADNEYSRVWPVSGAHACTALS
jgi:hypothetical protein